MNQKIIKELFKILFLNVFLISCSFIFTEVFAKNIAFRWSTLDPIIQSRVNQQSQKMKLQEPDAKQFKMFLRDLHKPLPQLEQLEKVLPKTTVELLMGVNKRGMALKEAEKMAEYLKVVIDEFRFSNLSEFDENTSHIIGREWFEIDYSGEDMTWQKQKAKYQRYGIEHFKSLNNLKKFIPVECRLSYFNKVYKPKNPRACL